MVKKQGSAFLDLEWAREQLETLIAMMCWDLVEKGVLEPEDCPPLEEMQLKPKRASRAQ